MKMLYILRRECMQKQIYSYLFSFIFAEPKNSAKDVTREGKASKQEMGNGRT